LIIFIQLWGWCVDAMERGLGVQNPEEKGSSQPIAWNGFVAVAQQ
jgi:hypothetical protein